MNPISPFKLGGLLLALFVGPAQAVAAEATKPKTSGLPVQELRAFAEIFGRIKSDYVEPVEDKVLLENAIRGMLNGLDPHSAYLNEEDYKEIQVGTRGEFGGLGIEVGLEDGFIKVVSPIDDTPAERAGLQTGDLIIRLDEKPVKGMSLNEAVKLMRGKPGTEVTLLIVRRGNDKPFKVTLVRDVIHVASVKGRILEEGFAYVRVAQFQSNTTDDMLKLLSRLKKENNGNLKGLVLDLRNNPGGVLSSAVSMSDAFLTKGLIVYTEGRTEDSELKYDASPDDVLSGAPIVILVNEGSASASEIVAGALQDHKRAVVMGQPTFGKGSVQTVIPLTSSTAVKLTTARYFTPSGRSIQAEGIRPDILLEELKVSQAEDTRSKTVKEADLSGHLGNGKAKNKSNSNNSSPEAEDKVPLPIRDYQLSQALNMLKGLYLLKAKETGG